MTGKSFAIVRKLFPQLYEKILVNGTIYARMSPDNKAQLVEDLISLDYCVSMCGDGANDCGALKAGELFRKKIQKTKIKKNYLFISN